MFDSPRGHQSAEGPAGPISGGHGSLTPWKGNVHVRHLRFVIPALAILLASAGCSIGGADCPHEIGGIPGPEMPADAKDLAISTLHAVADVESLTVSSVSVKCYAADPASGSSGPPTYTIEATAEVSLWLGRRDVEGAMDLDVVPVTFDAITKTGTVVTSKSVPVNVSAHPSGRLQAPVRFEGLTREQMKRIDYVRAHWPSDCCN